MPDGSQFQGKRGSFASLPEFVVAPRTPAQRTVDAVAELTQNRGKYQMEVFLVEDPARVHANTLGSSEGAGNCLSTHGGCEPSAFIRCAMISAVEGLLIL